VHGKAVRVRSSALSIRLLSRECRKAEKRLDIYRVHSDATRRPNNLLVSLDAFLGKRLNRRSVEQKQAYIHERLLLHLGGCLTRAGSGLSKTPSSNRVAIAQRA
jgi:hypothetical protein